MITEILELATYTIHAWSGSLGTVMVGLFMPAVCFYIFCRLWHR